MLLEINFKLPYLFQSTHTLTFAHTLFSQPSLAYLLTLTHYSPAHSISASLCRLLSQKSSPKKILVWSV